MLIALLLGVLVPAAGFADAGFAGPEGEPLPFSANVEILDFMRSATIVSSTELTTGVNRPLKLLLQKDGTRMHAVFRRVDQKRRTDRYNGRLIVRFHDYFGYEVAAYQLSRLLGLDNVPPATLHRLRGRDGSIQVWVENVRTEARRREDADKSPRSLEWVRQWQIMRLFDALIDNFDRNIGNILIDSNWKVWLIDHGRSFTVDRDLYQPERITMCERGVWQRLRDLDQSLLETHLGEILSKPRIVALMRRRDLLVDHIEKLIATRGEDIALFELSGVSLAGERQQGEAGFGETVVGETVVGETVVGETVVGETVVGETVVSETVAGETVEGVKP